MSGQSSILIPTLAELGERLAPNDAPRISVDDELLEALKREHGPDGRPDLVIPRTTMTPNRRAGWPRPTQWQIVGRGLNFRASMMWFAFQSAIILAVVQSNVSWRWADHGIQVGIVGVGLAYLATLVVGGWGRPQIRGEKIVLKMTTKVVVSTAAVVVAAGLCWQGARAQAEINALRPPMPFPVVDALMPPRPPMCRSRMWSCLRGHR